MHVPFNYRPIEPDVLLKDGSFYAGEEAIRSATQKSKVCIEDILPPEIKYDDVLEVFTVIIRIRE